MTEHSDGRSFVTGMIMGALVGLAVGFLYAPKPGSETRAMIKEKASHAAEEAKHIVEKAREKANSIIATAHDEAAHIRAGKQKEAGD
jgi:gas vesicle protein